ncbi:MAG: hypothetical protein K6G69_03600 [Lachnospiraceae bacterium]|nr:hypothetical protein [Lachnospiraceae bacterium]
MLKIFLYIVSVIVNAVFYIILNIDLYTDTFHLPDGNMGSHQRSPISSLYTADKPWLLYIQVLMMIVSAVTALLLIFGVKNKTVKIAQIVATAGSILMFIIIMIYTSKAVHPRY